MLVLASYGARIGVSTSEPAVADGIRGMMPFAATIDRNGPVDTLYELIFRPASIGDGSGHVHLARDGSVLLSGPGDLATALRALETDAHFQVALFARGVLFVHAGVVGWKGKALVMPGRSLTGKSSLVAALVRRGAAYYSDEYAVVDARGCVHPYPRALSLRTGSGQIARVGVEALSGRVDVKPLPVGMIVASTYRPGARWRPRRLSAGQATLRLIDNTVLAVEHPALALQTMKNAASGALALSGPRGEAERVAGQLLRRLDREGEAPAGAEAAAPV